MESRELVRSREMQEHQWFGRREASDAAVERTRGGARTTTQKGEKKEKKTLRHRIDKRRNRQPPKRDLWLKKMAEKTLERRPSREDARARTGKKSLGRARL